MEGPHRARSQDPNGAAGLCAAHPPAPIGASRKSQPQFCLTEGPGTRDQAGTPETATTDPAPSPSTDPVGSSEEPPPKGADSTSSDPVN